MSEPGTVEVVEQSAADAWAVDDHTAACVVFSPPYNAGIDYDNDTTADQMPWDDYEHLANQTMTHAARALIEGGRAFVNITPSVPTVAIPAGDHSGQTSNGRTSLTHIWMTAALQAGLNYRDTIAWVTEGRGPSCAWGSYQSPAGPNMRGEWEAILCFSQGSWARPTPEQHKGWKDTEGNWPRLTTNAWKIRPETDRTHPAPYPLELPSRCIRLSTFPTELVIDPYCGSGTTLLAARNLGRNAIGLEQSSTYVAQTQDRLAQLTMFGATG